MYSFSIDIIFNVYFYEQISQSQIQALWVASELVLCFCHPMTTVLKVLMAVVVSCSSFLYDLPVLAGLQNSFGKSNLILHSG
jgi:hypothetical protein